MRTNRLLQAFDQVAGLIIKSCSECHGPTPGVSGVIVLWEKEELRLCTACQRPVDDAGASLAGVSPTEGVRLHIVRVSKGMGYAPALPGMRPGE